ncbi:hypothetical protein HanIR_Chr12g0614901 [Helianthus annuus]|nr:hypothetical protein HanIR_Chr12g0614901 [Helianthus annuus]
MEIPTQPRIRKKDLLLCDIQLSMLLDYRSRPLPFVANHRIHPPLLAAEIE